MLATWRQATASTAHALFTFTTFPATAEKRNSIKRSKSVATTANVAQGKKLN